MVFKNMKELSFPCKTKKIGSFFVSFYRHFYLFSNNKLKYFNLFFIKILYL